MEQYFNIIEWAYDISVFAVIIPAVIAIFRWKFFNFPMKIAGLGAFRALIQGSISQYFAYTEHSQRLLYHISPCLDIILISLLTLAIFDFRKELKWGLSLLCVVFIGLMINDYVTSKTLMSSNLTTAETVFVIIVSILMLRKVVLQYKSSTYKRSLVWILSALLIGNLFSVLFSTLMETISAYSAELMQFSWYSLAAFSGFLNNFMVAYGFYIIDYKVKDK